MAAEDLIPHSALKTHASLSLPSRDAGLTPLSDGCPRYMGHEVSVATPAASATARFPDAAKTTARVKPRQDRRSSEIK